VQALKNELRALECRQTELQQSLAAREAPAPLIHPNLAEVYRQRVAALQDPLHAPSSRDEAFDLIRLLIEQVRALASLGQRRPGKTLAADCRS
jgi:site-specific DNA recombinase